MIHVGIACKNEIDYGESKKKNHFKSLENVYISSVRCIETKKKKHKNQLMTKKFCSN